MFSCLKNLLKEKKELVEMQKNIRARLNMIDKDISEAINEKQIKSNLFIKESPMVQELNRVDDLYIKFRPLENGGLFSFWCNGLNHEQLEYLKNYGEVSVTIINHVKGIHVRIGSSKFNNKSEEVSDRYIARDAWGNRVD